MIPARPFFQILLSFSLAAAVGFWWSISQPSAKASIGRNQIIPQRPPGGPLLSTAKAKPPGEGTKPQPLQTTQTTAEADDRLAKRCQELLETDPAAAFRAAMAEWHYDRNGLTAAAEALVKKDPEAARRLLEECPDLRSRNVLECALMADEVSRNPQEKLAWADSTLTGNIRIAALKAGLAALGKQDPDAALAFASTLPPSLGFYNVTNNMLRELMRSDPAKAIGWMSANYPPDKLGITSSIILGAYLKDNPGAGPGLMSTLSPDLQKNLAFAMVADSKYRADPAKPFFPQLLEQVHNLPPELQAKGLAALNWVTEPGTPGRTTADLLPLLSDPRERSEIVRRIVGDQLRYLSADSNAPLPDGVDLIQTPADKQEIARMLPWLKNLSESQRTALEARLK